MDTDAGSRDLRPAGIAGWAATVLLFTGVILLSSTGTPEPEFDASAAEIQRYLETQNPTAFATGNYLLIVGLLALLWFISGLSAQLRRLDARPEWLPTVVLVSGAATVGAFMTGAVQAGGFRGSDGLDPQVAQLAFDLGSLSLANLWAAFGSLSLAAGWAILAGRAVPGRRDWPRWLGWWALGVGAGFLGARAVWTTPLWLLPYGLFWVWVLVVSTRMLRTRPAPEPVQPRPATGATG
jgi:hypothetical protein